MSSILPKNELETFNIAFVLQNIYYTGSFFDGLRIENPDEFDLNIVLDLKLPKQSFRVSRLSYQILCFLNLSCCFCFTVLAIWWHRWWAKSASLVRKGLTDLQKMGVPVAPSVPPSLTSQMKRL